MIKFKIILALFAVGIVLGIRSVGSTQPNISKENIPMNIPADVKKEILRLYSSDPIDRAGASFCLGKMGSRATQAIPFLIDVLEDETDLELSNVWNSQVIEYTSPSKEARKALVKIGKPVVEPLIAALKDVNFHGKGRAAEALGELKDSRAVKPLISIFEDDANYRYEEALVKTGVPAAKPLVALLKDGNRGARWRAARALGKIRDRRAVEPLIAALKDEYPLVQSTAASSLGEIKDLRAIEPLIAALKDVNFHGKGGAAEALGELKDGRAVKSLIAVLNDEDITVRWRAAEALGKLNNRGAIEPLIVALSDEDSNVRSSAAAALGEIKDSRGIKPLIAALNDDKPRVRCNAAEALGEIKDPRSVEPLIAALKDKDEDVRSEVVIALGTIKDRRAVEPLIVALKDKWSYVREGTAEALRKITGKDFGENTAKWQKWWVQNKEKFQKTR